MDSGECPPLINMIIVSTELFNTEIIMGKYIRNEKICEYGAPGTREQGIWNIRDAAARRVKSP
ncbi:MAG: hypothetical protein M1510_07515 [Nitrospirae bacterium]|nr:hypothetical protein [Nitrospirota bacterium]MCL5236948.1 hypothetical protein [Nitrospirota bacterium]